MNKKFLLLLVFLCSIFKVVNATEITGRITNNQGEPLSFANVYQLATTLGTTSNIEGIYTLDLAPGSYTLVFQYIGYKERIEKLVVGEEPMVLDITLEAESVELSAIVVAADSEDPAYAVIRKAIKKRKYFRDMVNGFSCDVYIKGNQKVLAAPEKIMGQDLGDLRGTLDSNRQGIVYLSESVSKLYYQRPNKYKEEMISSKVSGDDMGFSFNQARLMNISFYDNTLDMNGIGRPLISPISNAALLSYNYKLIGTFYDKEGRLVNKIEVIPKRELDPVFRGHIYIIEDLWNIHSTDLYITKDATKIPFMDTVTVNQLHVNVQDSIWVQLSQTIGMGGAFLGFRIKGYFSGVFSNYNINPEFDNNFFDGEILNVFDLANLKSLAYWDSIRPVPLTKEETVDYVKKDSLQVVWKSKKYLDSLDKKDNKLKVFNLLTGYSYRRSYKKREFEIDPPLNTLQFNTVQGWNLAIHANYKQWYDDDFAKWYRIGGSINYGFAEKKVRGTLKADYNFNRIKYSRISVSGGITLNQFNHSEPITPMLNSFYSLFYRENHMKLYQRTFGKIRGQHEVINGVFLIGSIEYANRQPLTNQSDYSFYHEDDRTFQANDPLDPTNTGVLSFLPNNALLIDIAIRIRLNQQYLKYPNRKYVVGSKFPDIWLKYRKAIPILGASANYDIASIGIQEKINMKLVGNSQFNVEAGTFLNKKEISFVDYRHFYGNQTVFSNYNKYLMTYQLMPYYAYSTSSTYVQAHYEHHFDGFLLNKIPFVKKLGFTTVAGLHYLYTKESDNYMELTIGLDKIGWSLFRFVRIDYVAEILSDNKIRSGFVIGLKIPAPN